jgi:protein arginine N-methyltransferase 1
MRIEYHRTLIADKNRNEAFYAALKALIEPGRTVVADIGAGTGLLGLMAAKLGAKEVFLFETAEVAAVAAEVLKANKARNCHLIPCHSSEFDEKLEADVIVSETLGNYALEENIIATLADARRRFLKRGGKVVPKAISQFVAPVVGDRVDGELRAWRRVGWNIDYASAERMSLNNAYVRLLKPSELLTRGTMQWDRIDLTQETRSARKGNTEWRIRESKTVYGLALWWTAELAAEIALSTAPEAPRTHWEQLYLPLLEPIKAKSGERLRAVLRSNSSEKEGTHLAWQVTHSDADSKVVSVQKLDLDKGFLP